jgi:acyl-CoA reductase-like NAD-dependent aldehyde dehydrogenase
MNHDKMTSEGGKIWRETNGFAVLRNATLRQLRNEAAALKEADSKWRSLSQEERDERNRVAKAIWDAANPPVETPEERVRD